MTLYGAAKNPGDVDELTDSSTGTADGTVEAMPATQGTPSGMTAAEKAAIDNNFAELTAKMNALLDALKR